MDAEKPVILVVDDEVAMVKYERLVLEQAGFALVTATSGREALDMVARKHPDLVLLDVVMPDMDGLAVCDRIRKLSKARIILISGKKMSFEDKAAGLAMGADDYVSKPFTAIVLVARARAVLRRAALGGPPR